MIEIYTDGACRGNNKQGNHPGGWGCIIVVNNELTMKKTGFNPETTNNQMELMGFLNGLKLNIDKTSECIIYSDSQYVIKGVTEWRQGWIRKNFKDIKNIELWHQLYAEWDKYTNIKAQWVKAHNGHKWNEIVDKLAVDGSNGIII